MATSPFATPLLDGPRAWPITGFDARLLAQGTPGLLVRDEDHGSDADAYRAVLEDPSLAIVPENFLVAGVDVAALSVGDRFTAVGSGGTTRDLTIAGIGQADWMGNGALVGREVTTALLGPDDVVSRAYVQAADGTDPADLASALDASLLANGADARTFVEIGTEGVGVLLGFMAMMQGFLGLGLLVGIAGLGVVMVRAVRERRQEIGMLRAMGFRTGLVRTALLSEAGLIAVQGTVIGALLGLVTTRQILSSSDAFGGQVPFAVPWAGLLVILSLPLAASLAATAWPASRAAAVRPAVALRSAT